MSGFSRRSISSSRQRSGAPVSASWVLPSSKTQRSGSTTTGAPGSAGWTGSAPTSRGRTPADEPGRQLRAGDRRPPEAVFAAFTGQDGQEAFNSEPGWIVESECDLRVGGVWTVTFGLSRDELHRHEHVFGVIDRPHRLLLDTTENRPDGGVLRYATELIFEDRDGKTLDVDDPLWPPHRRASRRTPG